MSRLTQESINMSKCSESSNQTPRFPDLESSEIFSQIWSQSQITCSKMFENTQVREVSSTKISSVSFGQVQTDKQSYSFEGKQLLESINFLNINDSQEHLNLGTEIILQPTVCFQALESQSNSSASSFLEKNSAEKYLNIEKQNFNGRLIKNQQVSQKARIQKKKTKRYQRGQEMIKQGLKRRKEIQKKFINFEESRVTTKRQRFQRLQFWWQQKHIAKQQSIERLKRRDFRQILFRQEVSPILQFGDLRLSTNVCQVTLVIQKSSTIWLNKYISLRLRVLGSQVILQEQDKITIDEGVKGLTILDSKLSTALKLVNLSSKNVKLKIKMIF